MAARVSEAFILRTYPLREADLIVSFFTRDLGKLRGVARRARKPASKFGSGLGRLSYVRLFYFHRENRDLDTLDGCELIRSPWSGAGGFEASVALDYIAELSEQLLPAGEPQERFFRLMIAATTYLEEKGEAALWPAVNYFTLWAVRLQGILPPLEWTEDERALAEEMLRTPVTALQPREWTRLTAAGLRRKLQWVIEEHVERRLVTVAQLESL